nr:MAG TPA: metallophosphatase domain protein [Herelleviridae sp.]
MIFVTGDTHGDWMTRLNSRSFPEGVGLTKDDYVIICGDFGLWHDTKEERYNLEWLDSKPFTTLFVCGNHENYDRLYEYPVEKWCGGKIHKICSSVFHLMRGQVFDIQGKRFFTFGGASSHDVQDGILEPDDSRISKWYRDYDKMFRINHTSWWKEELPSEEEMTEGMMNLKQNGSQVDYIITHSPYTSALRQMDQGSGVYKTDILTDYLQEIKESVEYKKWFFGHMHVNKNFLLDNAIAIYEQIVRIS